MPTPRSSQICLDTTPYYHCLSRCVRRAFLCGTDPQTNQSFEHRRTWIEERLLKQAQVFTIDLVNYSIMNNHYHAILHVNRERSSTLSMKEIIIRWHKLYKGSYLSQMFIADNPLEPCELDTLKATVKIWRTRLMDISWFMKCLNEFIARKANLEDDCTGHFWEGRFKLQPLLNENALAACMTYVDLNPIRAGEARTPEESNYTSIKRRIEKARKVRFPNRVNQQSKLLMPFAGNTRDNMPFGLPFKLTDYIELVDWSGRVKRSDKRGSIDNTLPPIISRLGINFTDWTSLTDNFENKFRNFSRNTSSTKSFKKLTYNG